MDEKFLEFWGNLLLNAARGKKQSDDISNWMQKSLEAMSGFSAPQQSVSSVEEVPAMFQKFYGLDQLPERSSEYQSVSKKATEDFQESFNNYLSMMGIVSKKEYLDIVEKYEKLKVKCAGQEETIKHLQMLLDAKNTDQGDAVRGLQNVMKDQTELFQKMLTGFSRGTGKKESDSTGQAEEQKESKGLTGFSRGTGKSGSDAEEQKELKGEMKKIGEPKTGV